MSEPLPTIVILGASGLIGEAVASHLRCEGFSVVPIARRFNTAQKNSFGSAAIESPIVALTEVELANILSESKSDIVVNCIGVLQDSHRGHTDNVIMASSHGSLTRWQNRLSSPYSCICRFPDKTTRTGRNLASRSGKRNGLSPPARFHLLSCGRASLWRLPPMGAAPWFGR